MKIFSYSVRLDEEKYIKEFCKENSVICDYVNDYPTMENVNLALNYDAVSIITNVISDEMINSWKNLGIKYIITRTVGYDHLNIELIKSLGMVPVHASYSPNAVANYAIMLMLMSVRKINFILEKSKRHDYSLDGNIGKELSLMNIGIIGTGKIGETVIKHLSGFGCNILAYDIYQSESVKKYAKYVTLDELYSKSDLISLHIPGGKENYHMINKSSISRMKDDCIIVNTARGLLINTSDLIEALKTKKIGFAALDTFEEEIGLLYKNFESKNLKIENIDILNSLENVILSPHMAFYTEQSSSDMVKTSLKAALDHENEIHNDLIL